MVQLIDNPSGQHLPTTNNLALILLSKNILQKKFTAGIVDHMPYLTFFSSYGSSLLCLVNIIQL